MPLITAFFRVPWTRKRARKTRMALQFAFLVILLLVVLPLYMLYKPPVFIINLLQRHSPQVLYHVPTSYKAVALTIDDGPSQYTNEILEILRANQAYATFFVIGGQVSGREDILRSIVESDNELGNHAMHDEPAVQVPSERLNDEIMQVDSIIEHAYASAGRNRTMNLFRPGSGIFSERILDVATSAGYRTILGSIYPHDPFIPYWRINALHILSSLQPGAVIICHDRRSWTAPMLKSLLPAIRARGYEILTVSELLDPSYAD